MFLCLKHAKYKINNHEGEINFKKKNIFRGKNNAGKTMLISSILIALGSTYENREFVERVKTDREVKNFVFKLEYIITPHKNSITKYPKNKIYKINCEVKLINNKLYYDLEILCEDKELYKKSNITSTTEYSAKILEILGIPRKIIWTRSLNSVLMDDILRFSFIPQDEINSINQLKKILPLGRAETIRITLISLYFRNPSNELLKKMIENEDLFRIRKQEEILKELRVVTKSSVIVENKEQTIDSHSITKILKYEKEIENHINERKPLMQNKRIFQALNSKDNILDIISYLSKIKEMNGITEETFKWLTENEESFKLKFINEYKKEEEENEARIKEINTKIKLKRECISKINDLHNDKDKILLIGNFMKNLPKNETEKPKRTIITEIKEEFENNHSRYKKEFDEWMGKGFCLHRWKKNGGATNVINNVMRLDKINTKLSANDFLLPIIVDGIIAEDFDDNNINDPIWVNAILKGNYQSIITLASISSENKKKENKILENISKYIENIDEKDIEIYEVPDIFN